MNIKDLAITAAACLTIGSSVAQSNWVEDNYDKDEIMYFTIEEHQNRDLYRNGLSKLLNSLSWTPAIVNPGEDGDKFWILTEWYGWNSYQVDQILELYPEEVPSNKPPTIDTGWFIKNASIPPLYHTLLYDGKQEIYNESELIKTYIQPATYFDPLKNQWYPLNEGLDQAAAVSESQVTNANRRITRSATDFGSYWRSDDFAVSKMWPDKLTDDVEDEFARLIVHLRSKSNNPNGNEIIFNLPNGLQGYFLVDASGRRIDKAPTDIVSGKKFSKGDPNRDFGIGDDSVIYNGISCMGCHSYGVNIFRDEVRPKWQHTIDNGKFNNTAKFVYFKYIGNEELNKIILADNGRFADALKQIDSKFNWLEEPIFKIASEYIEETYGAPSKPKATKRGLWANQKRRAKQ